MLEDFGFDGGLELRSRTHCGGGGGRDDKAVRESEAISKDSFGLRDGNEDGEMACYLLRRMSATEVSDPVHWPTTSQLTPYHPGVTAARNITILLDTPSLTSPNPPVASHRAAAQDR
jgi:hypothetical protein